MGYRYIGSKEKLADTIIDKIRDVRPDSRTIIDLMAGTGLFSKSLRSHGYTVVAADMMKYSYHHLVYQLLLSSAPEFMGFIGNSNESRYQSCLSELNALDPIEGFFFNEFSPEGHPKNIQHPRMYFTSYNAGKIDSIRAKILDWNLEHRITEIEHSLLLHDLIMATNDIANIAGTYGHYLSHFVGRARDVINLKQSTFEINGNNTGHVIHCGMAEVLAPNLTGDVCYIDPPYIKRQYAANYHILETIAQEDFPDAIGESGLRDWWNKYSNFCSKRKIRESFHTIITNINAPDIFVSYSEDGLLSLDEIRSFFENYGETSLYQIPYKRFKSNDSQKGIDIIEYLFHISKR